MTGHPDDDFPTSASSPWIGIAPIRIQMASSYHTCLSSVCHENRYLMNSCAPDVEDSRRFVARLLHEKLPMYVAFIPGLRVVGWCDVYRLPHPCQYHVGRLGMGIHRNFREQGLGTILIERTLKAAALVGIERVELNVFCSNTRAINLYEKFGFQIEGHLRRARKQGTDYEDMLLMARLTPATSLSGISPCTPFPSPRKEIP